jgi:hypothetical protein
MANKCKKIKIESLQTDKKEQLTFSADCPSMYISLEGYSLDETKIQQEYELEIGTKSGDFVVVRKKKVNLNKLYEFDKKIRPLFEKKSNKQLLTFPPRKIVGKPNKEFIEKQTQHLKKYLGCLVKIPDLVNQIEFSETFRE